MTALSDQALAGRVIVVTGAGRGIGAGIVEASDPAKEAEETRSKARSALCAIEAAGRGG